MFSGNFFSAISFRFLIPSVHGSSYSINLLAVNLYDLISIDAFPDIGHIFDSAILVAEIIGMFSYIYG